MSMEFMACTKRDHQVKEIINSLKGREESLVDLNILILNLKHQGLSHLETAQALRDLRFISLTDCKQLTASYFSEST
jgi:hypothetical protein